MRIATITALVILSAATATSQITITAADMQTMFAVGKSWRTLLVANTTSTIMNVGGASAVAQSWAFPAGAITDTVRQDNINPSATPYGNLFKSATHAQKYTYDMQGAVMQLYAYYRITTDSLIQLGNVTHTQMAGLDTTIYDIAYRPEFSFPWTRGKSTHWRDSTDLGGGAYTIGRYIETADGFGDLTLPSGTFQGLRLKNLSLTDTYAGGVVIQKDSIVTVDWITKEGYTMSVTPADMYSSSGFIPISTYSYSTLITTPSAVVADGGLPFPKTFHLNQNYPNPFNPATTISFSIPSSEFVTLKIFDALGSEVATVVSGELSAGNYARQWNASGLSSGVYFYRLRAGSFTETKRFILQK